MKKELLKLAMIAAVESTKPDYEAKIIRDKAIDEFEMNYEAYATGTMVQKIMYYIAAGAGENLEYEMIGQDHKISFDSIIFAGGFITEKIIITVSQRDLTIDFEQAIGKSVIEWHGEVITNINEGKSHVYITADNEPKSAASVPVEIKRFINTIVHHAIHPVSKTEFKSLVFATVTQMIIDSPRRNIRNIAAGIEEKRAQENLKRNVEAKYFAEKSFEKRKKELIKHMVSRDAFNEVKSEYEKVKKECETAKKELEAIKATTTQKPEADFLPTEKAPSPTKKTATKTKKGNNNSSTK